MSIQTVPQISEITKTGGDTPPLQKYIATQNKNLFRNKGVLQCKNNALINFSQTK